MLVVCPCCASAFPLEAGLNDADARRFAVLMGELPPAVARSVPRYLQLFKPEKHGLRWSRALSLLEELSSSVLSGETRRHGRDWKISNEQWARALETVVAKDDLRKPVKSHALLYEIASSLADKSEAAAETKVEKQRQSGAHRETQPQHRETQPQHRETTTNPIAAREILKGITTRIKGPSNAV